MSENRKDKGPFGEKAKVSGLNHVGGKRDGESTFALLELSRVDFRERSRLTRFPVEWLFTDISVIVAIVGDPTHS